ncbi:ABC transporter permease [Roseixanthobacter liquoris]|uniref:ABC transporter permease n=1 Tax=Roseixanthobacter liquoris TaxID=3119921 RepID=UPI00372B0306
MNSRLKQILHRYGPPLVAGIIIFGLWEALPRLFGVSALLIPPPSSVLRALWIIFDRGLLVGATLVTLFEALSGFLIGSAAAVACAFLVTRSELIERALMPYLVGFQALPKVALAPLIVVWVGIGIESKIAIAAIISFFPVLINAIIGFSTIEAEKIDLMRSLVASRWQEFHMVVFPNSLPFIFAGLNVAIVFSITGALVGEFIGADRGLGNLLMQLNYNMDVSGMFAVLVVLALLGIALHAMVRFFHVRLVFWGKPKGLQANDH